MHVSQPQRLNSASGVEVELDELQEARPAEGERASFDPSVASGSLGGWVAASYNAE